MIPLPLSTRSSSSHREIWGHTLSRPKLVPTTTSPRGHIKHSSELDVGHLPCLNQYNPCVSKPNHPDQTHEHTKIYLPTLSNPDTRVSFVHKGDNIYSSTNSIYAGSPPRALETPGFANNPLSPCSWFTTVKSTIRLQLLSSQPSNRRQMVIGM
jgi:hypothetical protein